MHVSLLLLLACSAPKLDGFSAGGDTGADSGSETAGDSGNDTAADSGLDTVGDSGSDTAVDSGGDSGGDSDTGTEAEAAWRRVDTAGGVVARSVDVAIAPGGVVYASWVDGSEVAWVRRSDDAGTTWGAPVSVNPDGTNASVAMARRPYVTADDDRVAVVFVDLTSHRAEVYVSPADLSGFTHAGSLGVEAVNNDFAKPVFVEGDLTVEWQTYTPVGAMVLARESTGWVTEQVDAAIPGVPCECCPNDALVGSGGDLLIAFRNNDDNLREHWVAILPSGDTRQATDIEGQLMVCPMEGPRLAEAGGDVLLVWADASMEGRTWLESSTDGGRRWSNEVDIFGEVSTSSPTIAATSDGRVFVTTEMGSGSLIVGSADGGDTFDTPVSLDGPSGAIGYPQLDGAGGTVIAGGSAADGTAWVRRWE